MFNKLNRYLLLNHPLIWNLKVPQVLLFSLISCTVFYLLGYSSAYDFYAFSDYYSYKGSEVQVNLFAVLVLVLGLIIWLIYYLRNNAVKSFYPVTKSRLRKEFLLVWLCFFVSIPIFHFYYYGRHVRLMKISQDVDLVKDADLVNMAMFFLPQNMDDFDLNASCDTAKAREEYAKKHPYVEDNRCQGSYPQYNSEQITAMPTEADTMSHVIQEEVHNYSYLNYCKLVLTGSPEISSYDIHDKVARWLKNGNRDSVEAVLDAYSGLMKKYRLTSNINSEKMAANCFLDSNHTVVGIYSDIYADHGVSSMVDVGHAEYSTLITIISNIRSERDKNFYNVSEWLFYFYISLSLAIILCMFRFTRLKPWLISIIGLGIWTILFSIFGVITSSEETVAVIYMAMVLVALLLHISMIRNKQNKLGSAMWMHWFTFAFPAFVPVLMELIYKHTGEVKDCINGYWVVVKPEAPIHAWINHSWNTINYLNLLLMLLVVLFVVIPSALKWQANPSE